MANKTDIKPYLNPDTAPELSAKIAKDAGVTLSDCYQCGKCSSGCPMTDAMDIQPRQVVRYLQMGMADKILASKTIWLCASCHMCVDRCPNDINLPALIEHSRYEAKKLLYRAVPEVDKFNDIFIENIKAFGISQEAILEGAYNVTTGNFMQDMNNAPHMLRHGIVGPELHMVNEREEVRRIIKAAQEEDAKC